jgi:hypothetical protein
MKSNTKIKGDLTGFRSIQHEGNTYLVLDFKKQNSKQNSKYNGVLIGPGGKIMLGYDYGVDGWGRLETSKDLKEAVKRFYKFKE